MRGGIVTQYKEAKTLAFKSLAEVCLGEGHVQGTRRECGVVRGVLA